MQTIILLYYPITPNIVNYVYLPFIIILGFIMIYFCIRIYRIIREK